MIEETNILICEDLITDIELVIRELKKHGLQFKYWATDSEAEFLKNLTTLNPDIVLTDYMMPRFTGMRVLELVKEHDPLIPVIVVTGSMNEETAVECMKAGASDYVIKEHLKRLGPAVEHALKSSKIERQKRETELKLKETERWFKFIADNANDIIYLIRFIPDVHFEYLSPAFERISGYGVDEVYKNPQMFLNLIHQDDKSIIENFAARKNLNNNFITRWRTKDGMLIWIEMHSTPIYGENNEVVAVHGIARDITQRHLAEVKLKEREQTLSNLINNLPGFIYRCANNPNWTMLYISPGVKDITGYHPDELINNQIISYNDLILPKYRQTIWNKWQKALERRERVTEEYEIKTKDGQVRWVWEQGTGVFDENGNLLFIEGYITDVTEKKLAEITAREKEYAFQEIFNSTFEAIIIYDIQTGRIVDCNNRAVEMYGYPSKEEFLNCTYKDLGQTEEPFTKLLMSSASQKASTLSPQRFDWIAKKRNGEKFWVEVSLKRTNIGGVERELAVIRDITERKKFEIDIIKAKEKAEESDRLKSAFLANLSHEIRTPMNAIVGFADLLKLPVNDAKRNEYIDIIQKSGQRLLDIINETVEIARLEIGMVKPNIDTFDLNLLLKDIYNEMKMKASKNKELKLNLLNKNVDEEFYINTDKVKLQQILINLITNGIKYTPRGSVSFGYEIKNNRIKFIVKDTGIGIEKKYRELIFKRFFRVQNPLTIKAGGIGLGLAISKAYIELLGGTINLDSVIGQGTVVEFTIPYRYEEKVSKKVEEVPLEKLLGNNELILVAEDDDFNFLFINEILTSSNYKCLRATNGKEAVELAQKNNSIKLVLMDIKMPVMDGYQAFDQIRAIRPELPIVAQTAYTLGEDKERISKHGFDGHINKPIIKYDLLVKVREKLRR